MNGFTDQVESDSTNKTYAPLNIAKLQEWIASGRLDATRPIDVGAVFQSNLVHGIKGFSGVKLLGQVSLPIHQQIRELIGLSPSRTHHYHYRHSTCASHDTPSPPRKPSSMLEVK